MWRDFIAYAWRGSISRAGAWAPLPGTALIWLLLWWFGRRDVTLPTTLPGALEFFLACAGASWFTLFFARLLYAPFHFLKLARGELASHHTLPTLEILYDPTNLTYVRPMMALHGPTGEFYSIGVLNPGNQSLYDVTVRALDSWFTRIAIAAAQTGHSTRSHNPIPVFRKDALHPHAPEIVELFGLNYQPGSDNPDYVFNMVQRFTLEATARDASATRWEFEYDPKMRPMVRMLP